MLRLLRVLGVLRCTRCSGCTGCSGARGAQVHAVHKVLGAVHAWTHRVGVRRFEDLIAWQLAHELQQEVLAFAAKGSVSRDFKYCDQIRESSRSATRNTSEGFGRYYHKEFARFLRIAAGSLHETKNHLHDGRDRGYLPGSEHDRLVRLSLRAIKANARLVQYLQASTTPAP